MGHNEYDGCFIVCTLIEKCPSFGIALRASTRLFAKMGGEMEIVDEKVIGISKVKTLLALLGALVFVALGIWFLTLDAEAIAAQRKLSSPILFYGLGVVAIVFFGTCGIFAARKLFDSSPGLVLNRQGLIDNSSGISVGFVPWSEVSRIEEHQIQKHKFISIFVDNPERYMNAGNVLQRKARRANLKVCGTPISISSSALKIRYNDLHSAIEGYLNRYRENENVPPHMQQDRT